MKNFHSIDYAARHAGERGQASLLHVRRSGRCRAGLGVALALAVAGVLAGCSGSSAPPAGTAAKARDVTLTKAQQKSIHFVTVAPAVYHTRVAASGVVDFDHHHAVKVTAPFDGSVTKVLVTQGEHVRKGQALARVHSPGFATAVGAYRQAVLAARAADKVAANDRALYRHGAISARENDQAQATAAGADAARDAAMQQLTSLHMSAGEMAAIRAGKAGSTAGGIIRAPIAGTVVLRSIAPGQTLAAGSTACFTIADTSSMWVLANVFGADVNQVRVGDPARVDPGDNEPVLSGTVMRVGSMVDPATRSVAVRIAVANSGGRLRKGMYVNATIASANASQGFLVPVSAVLRDAENLPFVYVRTKAGSYARRPVQLGTRIGDQFVIAAGLHKGDQVVVEGGIFLRFIQNQ
ncbi:MAG TPA: efflux RND transporter periplasmic adaptor subunit [Rhodanobacteraceae bacterium]